MGYLQNSLIIMLSISTILLLAQFSIFQINPDTQQNTNYTIIPCNSMAQSQLNPLSGCDNRNPLLPTWSPSPGPVNGTNILHPEQATNDPTTGQNYNIINVISSVASYVITPLTFGWSVISSIVSLPYNALRQTGLPLGFIWAIGGLIVVMMFIYVSDWIKGGPL